MQRVTSAAQIPKNACVAFVIQRSELETEGLREDLRATFRKMGGAWPMCLDCWPESTLFLVAVANRTRMKKRAPLIMFAANLVTLEAALYRGCQELSDVKCAWVPIVDKEAQEIVTRVLLSEAESGGHA